MTFTRNSILIEFQECERISYNPNIVLNKIEDYQASSFPPSRNRPSTPSKAQI